MPPGMQEAVWFMGSLVRIRTGGAATGGQLAILEHEAPHGHGTPLHRHDVADETFLVLEGELRIEVDGEVYAAGSGSASFLPRGRPHAITVTSPQARYLTVHNPAGFDRYMIAAGILATNESMPDGYPADPHSLVALAAAHGIVILGPTPTLDS